MGVKRAVSKPKVICIEWRMIDEDLLIDQQTLDEEFSGDLVKHLRWCVSPEGGDMSVMDIVDLDHLPKIVGVKKARGG